MYLSNRKSKIITELINNDNYITGQYLANAAGVTSRTIRGDIAELNAELMEEGIQIHSSAGQGYYIDKTDKEKLLNIDGIQQDYFLPILPESRAEHILKQLVLHPNGISTEVISEQLFVSKSTLDRDVIKVNQRLIENGLRLNKQSGNIICIAGDEILIRDLYRSTLTQAVKLHRLDSNFYENGIKTIFENACDITHNFIDSQDADLTGDEFNEVVVFLTVLMFRNINGFKINEYNKKVSMSQPIAKLIRLVTAKLNISEHEEKYIADSLGALIDSNIKDMNRADAKEVINAGLARVKKTFEFSFSGESADKLLDIIYGNVVGSREISLKDIKKEYPLAAEMAISLVNCIKHDSTINICDAALAKIVLYFACEMEQDMLSKELKKRDVVIVCQSGESIKKLIEVKLKRHFPGFNILGFFPLYKLEKAMELNPEMIISTVMAKSDKIPVVVINPLFKDYDVLKINTVIKQIESSENSTYEFMNLFKEDLFIKGLETADKYDVIKKLCDKLRASGYAQDSFFQTVVERENISSTAIGNMVAIPHAINAQAGENVVAIGILKKPIDWNGEKVQLVFLINIQNIQHGNIQRIFKSFFEIINMSTKVDRIIKSKNYYEFLKTINQ